MPMRVNKIMRLVIDHLVLLLLLALSLVLAGLQTISNFEVLLLVEDDTSNVEDVLVVGQHLVDCLVKITKEAMVVVVPKRIVNMLVMVFTFNRFSVVQTTGLINVAVMLGN